MKANIDLKKKMPPDIPGYIVMVFGPGEIDSLGLNEKEASFAKSIIKKDESGVVSLNRYDQKIFVHYIKAHHNRDAFLENCRKAGDQVLSYIRDHGLDRIYLADKPESPDEVLAYCEGMVLGSYTFDKYKTENKDRKGRLKSLVLVSTQIPESRVRRLNNLLDAVLFCRDLVNEPVSHLNAVRMAERMKEKGEAAGMNVEVFSKKKIESLKMGGILAVNRGSTDPPTFTMMEWKPEGPVNEKPVVLVGKGVVFDTGGMNIKVGSYMEDMKCDMAGAATMASVAYAVARNRLPVHLITLIPATDNRLNGNAYVPGDVIKMHNGMTVEIVNTDAEGRMILADALSYASGYDPGLVIDAATLTGSASRAIGDVGIVAMHKDAEKEMKQLKMHGERVYERIAEFPFWDEYGELIKSDVADIKNIGGKFAGMITAGKFLARFTAYPFIHLDIAGPAFLDKKDAYRTKGGSGMGVRLLYEYIKGMVGH